MRVIVLGAGRVGYAIARDLVKEQDLEVTVADVSEQALQRLQGVSGLTTLQRDLGAADEVRRVVADFDLVVGAVPGPIGFQTVQAVIEAGTDIVDISFFEEDPFALDELARANSVRAVVDCGIAPGWSNLVAGYLQTMLDPFESFACYVGGLPVARYWPYEYRAVFSPIDVIAEYTRPARLVEAGAVVTRPALSEIELLDFPGVGTLEAFNSDGLRSLIRTLDGVPSMKEKTMRYPGHADKMRMLRETGFFGEAPISVAGSQVRPIDVTAALLFPAWQQEGDEHDLTVMRVVAEGSVNGHRCRKTYDLVDHYDQGAGITSMARTTGYTCTAGVKALAQGLYTEVGISPPELLGRVPGCFEHFNRHLAERGIVFKEQQEELA